MSIYYPKTEETFVYATPEDEGEPTPPKWLVIIIPHGDPRPVSVETQALSYVYDEERTQALRGRIHVLTEEKNS